MRTLDRHFLASRPEGDEKAQISITVPVSKRDASRVPPNADFTAPKVTLKAVGDSYADILLVLSTIHDDEGDMILEGVLEDLVSDDEMSRYSTLAEAAPLLKERTREVVTPFRTFSFGYELAPNDESEEVRSVDLEMTAPSVLIGIRTVYAMTKPVALTNLAIELCPRVDDDGDEYDHEEVLVRS